MGHRLKEHSNADFSHCAMRDTAVSHNLMTPTVLGVMDIRILGKVHYA